MVGAAQRGDRNDRLASVGSLPFRECFQSVDALVLEVLANDEHHGTGPGIDRHQHATGTSVIAELHRMRDVADADIALRRSDDLTRLHPATALDQFAIEPGLLEISDAVGHELGLIDRHRHRIDHPTIHIGCARAAAEHHAATRNDRQRRSSRDMGHQACSLSLPATLSRALNTASPISIVESFRVPGSAISAVRAPLARAV